MSSIKRITFRIIGLCALTIGIYSFVSILDLEKLTTVKGFINQLIRTMVNCIAVYGGFQLLKLNEIGRRLLLVWLSSQALTMVVVLFGWVYSTLSSRDFEISTYPSMPRPVIISFYLFCIVAVAYLLANRISEERIGDDRRHIYFLATGLSLLVPGLGRALAGNLFTGMIWFYLYIFLMAGLTISIDAFPAYMSWIARFLYYLVVWRILSAIDWSAVKGFEKSSMEKESDSTPELAHDPINGA